VDVLRKANAKVNWDAATKVVADVNCDGVADTAYVGYEQGAVWLGVLFGSRSQKTSKPVTMRFEVGRQSQGSFCGAPVKLETHPIECRTEDGPLPGCRRIKGCSDFSMVDEQCDSFHFYWNSDRKVLTWWRR
jgi:hypothetical protein